MREYGKDFLKDVEINKLSLADEAEVMPSMLRFYMDALAEAKTERDRADTFLDYTKARASQEIRRNGTGMPKDTEQTYKDAVETDSEVIDALTTYNKAKEVVYTLEVSVDAMRNKSDMIKVLKDLWIGGYFSAQ